MTAPIVVLDGSAPLTFTYEEMLRYSGPGSPAGVALAYQAMRCGFPWLGAGEPLERREITTATAFRGPGARDGFELVTRGVTEGNYVVDSGLERPDRGATLAAFVFWLAYRGCRVVMLTREGMVTEEFVSLARKERRNAGDERRLAWLKCEHADRLLSASPAEVFEVEVLGPDASPRPSRSASRSA